MLSRYLSTKTVTVLDSEGQAPTRIYASSPGIARRIRIAIQNGEVDIITTTLSEGQRLDSLAGEKYGDSSLWWIIAAANGIGYALQVAGGTELVIPVDLEQIARLI